MGTCPSAKGDMCKVNIPTPEGWATIQLQVDIPSHVLKAWAESIADKLEYGGYTGIELLVRIVDYNGTTDYQDVDIFTAFAEALGDERLINLKIRARKVEQA